MYSRRIIEKDHAYHLRLWHETMPHILHEPTGHEEDAAGKSQGSNIIFYLGLAVKVVDSSEFSVGHLRNVRQRGPYDQRDMSRQRCVGNGFALEYFGFRARFVPNYRE